jgi:hypothetical protein
MNPIHSKAMVRRKVREVLNMAPGYGKAEGLLLEYVHELTGGNVSLQELRDAMEYNHDRAYIRSEYDPESETVLWYITPAGVAQQKSLT